MTKTTKYTKPKPTNQSIRFTVISHPHPTGSTKADTTLYYHQREVKFWHKAEKTEGGLCRHFLIAAFSHRKNTLLTGLLHYIPIWWHIMSDCLLWIWWPYVDICDHKAIRLRICRVHIINQQYNIKYWLTAVRNSSVFWGVKDVEINQKMTPDKNGVLYLS